MQDAPGGGILNSSFRFPGGGKGSGYRKLNYINPKEYKNFKKCYMIRMMCPGKGNHEELLPEQFAEIETTLR